MTVSDLSNEYPQSCSPWATRVSMQTHCILVLWGDKVGTPGQGVPEAQEEQPSNRLDFNIIKSQK